VSAPLVSTGSVWPVRCQLGLWGKTGNRAVNLPAENSSREGKRSAMLEVRYVFRNIRIMLYEEIEFQLDGGKRNGNQQEC